MNLKKEKLEMLVKKKAIERARWSKKDVIIASIELNQPKSDKIKDWIVELKARHFPERTIEALKLRRKQAVYKNVIQRLKGGDYCNLEAFSRPLDANESQIFNAVLALSRKGSLNSKKNPCSISLPSVDCKCKIKRSGCCCQVKSTFNGRSTRKPTCKPWSK